MRRKVKIGDHWENVIKTQNLIIQKVRDGTKTALFISKGHSIELDENNNVIWADPGMHEFKPEIDREGVAVYIFYFVRKVATIEGAAKELAMFIDSLKQNIKVILLGHSKSGICIERACDYTKRMVDICFSVSAPHRGTITASKELYTKRVKNKLIHYIYINTFSDHQVDRDIVPGSAILERMKGHRPKCVKHINIVSILELKKAWKNPTELAMLYLDVEAKIDGDGIVPFWSQSITWTRKQIDEEIVILVSHLASLNKALKYAEKFLV